MDSPTFSGETRSSSSFYCQNCQAWLIPQANPYTLANMQRAFDILSEQGLPDFPSGKKLSATHWALQVNPADLSQQRSQQLAKATRTFQIICPIISIGSINSHII